MAVSKALERLLHIRGIEEEQRRLSLESALGTLESLKLARHAAGEKERKGRALLQTGATSGDIADRQAGLVEAVAAHRRALALAPRIVASELETRQRRQEFLDKRVERRQAERLIEKTEAEDVMESERRSQRAIDDLYGARRHHRAHDSESGSPTSSDGAGQE
jgi:hypothetical protein